MARKSDYLTTVDKIIGEKICSLRLAKGLSRIQLAEAIEVTHQQLQKYEKGLNRIPTGRLIRAARALGRNIGCFLEEIEEGEGVGETISQHQLMCMEVSRNFMKITNPKYQEVVNAMVRDFADKDQKTEESLG
jgi:transcriptional regulator with XRE-family HTH domain